MKKLDIDKVWASAVVRYRGMKAVKNPYKAPELLPDNIESDSARAITEALVEAVNAVFEETEVQ